jgi:hypothetical protein
MDAHPLALLDRQRPLRPRKAHKRRRHDHHRLTYNFPEAADTLVVRLLTMLIDRIERRPQVDSGSLPNPLRREPHERDPEVGVGLGQNPPTLGLRPA